MSFTAAGVRRFAAQAARQRASAYGGTVEDNQCDGHGRNLSVPKGDGTSDVIKFRAAFTRLLTAIDIRTHGKSFRCTAAVMLPNSLGLTIDETTLITHIVSGDVYEVAQIGIEHPAAAERRLLLRRREP